ncbi:hypothetical protein O3Q52_47830 [Streptomyces sp. ActVer]|uniref:hypothetical protein n=1 Tax=Streptomyces sp. ActVer TaxID=3014558 RepID=UPI0022B3E7B2|nr:hypothetical protein [Streptomyces sp. ActVer]MCZ4515694.1 hypothetical protein [Streptomyces sp. ActVer]
MTAFSIAQTARHLGLSDSGVRKMIERQELFLLPGTDSAKLDAEQVETVRLLRREALILDLASKRQTPVTLARDVRERLFPLRDTTVLPQYEAERQRQRLSLVRTEARQLFGVAALTAACVKDGCRWCSAQDFARILGGWAPDAYSEGFAALFAQEPCEVCGPRLYGAVLASLTARVHPGRQRLPDARAEAAAAAAPVPPAPRSEPARPVQRDDGKAMVSQRLRDVRGRLKDARRRGDTHHAMELQQQLQALTADAAVVDGRPTKARPGTLRCGHLLAQNCSCPRVASKRATS